MSDYDKVGRFLIREAAMLDGWRISDWLGLWIGEGSTYWVPSGADDIDPDTHTCIVHADWTGINQRAARLEGGYAHDQSPRSRFCRMVTNADIVRRDPSGALTVVSCFHLAEARGGLRMDNGVRNFMGRYQHELVPNESELGFKIKSKKIMLVNNDQFFEAMSFFL